MNSSPTIGQGMLVDLIVLHKDGKDIGIPSVCSSNRFVLDAVLRQAAEDKTVLLIEATANQCNQFGGYTGMVPKGFATSMADLARSTGFPTDRLILGGDHLGPTAWRHEPASSAMEKAVELVSAYVMAGFKKIHLDASMRCQDDPADGSGSLDVRIAAERTAALAFAAEEAFRLAPFKTPPLYVIGSDVPVPGGAEGDLTSPVVTRVEDAKTTLEETRKAFLARGLDSAWERVIAMVVQPGVEFGNNRVFEYDPLKAESLSAWIGTRPGMVFEAHSTDYQSKTSLRRMVQDHFAVLKVGPWFTFAFREAVFAMSAIEQEWLGERKDVVQSSLVEVVEEAMVRNPLHWKRHYHGDSQAAAEARKFSLSDRIRYYWNDPSVSRALDLLIENLSRQEVPLSLLSRHMPAQAEAVRIGRIPNIPLGWIRNRISEVYQVYTEATQIRTLSNRQGE
jgi:D-tagatose-1,6-bisphosphate aldolase subunit GatZ/KbaZ